MKKISYIMFALLGMGTMAEAQTQKQTIVDGVSVNGFKWNVMAGTWS